MNKTKAWIATAALLAAAASPSYAAVGNYSFASDNTAAYSNPAPLTSGSFSDTLNFSGLAAGLWDISFTLTGQNLSGLDIKVGGADADSIQYFGPLNKYVFAWADVQTNTVSPLVAVVAGTAGSNALYAGTVSAVPEPQAIALALAGLGLIAALRRRSRRSDAR